MTLNAFGHVINHGVVVVGEQLKFIFIVRGKNRLYEMRNGVMTKIAGDISNAKRLLRVGCGVACDWRLKRGRFGRHVLVKLAKLFVGREYFSHVRSGLVIQGV
jgi:hypothetical protein